MINLINKLNRAILSDLSDELTNNLLDLEYKSNIKVFKKRNNNWILRDARKIIDECNRMKKRKVIDLSITLKNICIGGNIELHALKTMQLQTNLDIDALDNIINIVSSSTSLSTNKYIEIYEN